MQFSIKDVRILWSLQHHGNTILFLTEWINHCVAVKLLFHNIRYQSVHHLEVPQYTLLKSIFHLYFHCLVIHVVNLHYTGCSRYIFWLVSISNLFLRTFSLVEMSSCIEINSFAGSIHKTLNLYYIRLLSVWVV